MVSFQLLHFHHHHLPLLNGVTTQFAARFCPPNTSIHRTLREGCKQNHHAPTSQNSTKPHSILWRSGSLPCLLHWASHVLVSQNRQATDSWHLACGYYCLTLDCFCAFHSMNSMPICLGSPPVIHMRFLVLMVLCDLLSFGEGLDQTLWSACLRFLKADRSCLFRSAD